MKEEIELSGATKQLEKEIREAYIFLREKNMSIPSETLEFMLQSSLDALKPSISPSTVTEMIEALREYHDQLSKWSYPSEQEINRMNFKAEEVLSKADKELKK